MISTSPTRVLAELRSAADIVEVIGEHTRLKKAGRSWKGLCPFHNERTPSFTVDRDKGLYHCFGCGAGGDVIHFVRQMDRLEFPEAVEALAGRFGVTIPRRARGPRDDRREKLLEAVAAAQRFYAAELAKPGQPRGRVPDGARRGARARLTGSASATRPDSWDALSRALSAAYPESLLVEAGLLQPGQEGKRAYDRFRDRLLFVLRDERGRPIGFGGRSLSPEGEPKYLNSPESPIFQKKRTLYGLSDAREAMRRRERVVLVEGYFDHLALVSAGHRRDGRLDGDGADARAGGKAAAPRARGRRLLRRRRGGARGHARARWRFSWPRASRRRSPGFRPAAIPTTFCGRKVRRASPPGSKRRRTRWPGCSTTPTPSEPGLSPAEKSERIGAILEILQAIPDAILRHEECRAPLAPRRPSPQDILWERIRPKDPPGRPRRPAVPPGTPGNRPVLQGGEIPASERRLLQILLGYSEHNPLILRTLKDEFLTHPGAIRVLSAPSERRWRNGKVLIFKGKSHTLRKKIEFLCPGSPWKINQRPPKKVSRLFSKTSKKNT